ncbi:hypothetical protein BH24ACT23_BH24ACT23_11180 [soil metagenome]
MVRRTITLPEQIDQRVRAQAREGESFSAAVARLLEGGMDSGSPLPYIGIAEGGPEDSLRVEAIVGRILDRVERREQGDP